MMEKVTGIGGIFFRAKDPVALSAWYEKNLGIAMPPSAEGDTEWQQEAGPTVFAPMEESSEHFQNNSQLSINFRVGNLDALCAQLQAVHIDIDKDPTEYSYGKFASLNDPEGNQIQLWEPSKD